MEAFRKRTFWQDWCEVYIFKVLKKHKKPLQRQIHEAVNINRKTSKESLNSKDEFNYNNTKRLRLEEKTANPHDCKTCGALFNSETDMNLHDEKFDKKKIYNVCDYECFGMSVMQEHKKTKHLLTN